MKRSDPPPDEVHRPVLAWTDLSEHVKSHYAEVQQREHAKFNIPRTWEYFDPNRFTTEGCSGGDQRLRELRRALRFFDETGTKRSKHQRMFHEAFIASCVRHIYKKEFAPNYMRILKENQWDEARQEVLVCCPRRFGKTFAVGMFVAAYAMTQPNSSVCIFSPGRRQSEMMLQLIKDFVYKFPNVHAIKENKENLWLRGDNINDTRKIMAYPSKVETLKGVGGDVIICEEAAAMDMGVFYEVVVPLMELDETALICISTIKASVNANVAST
jgi:hypothetical protein